MPIGPLELVIILVIVLVLFGATRLPQVGKGLGTGLREFKESVTGSSSDRELEAGEQDQADGEARAEAKDSAAQNRSESAARRD